MTAARTTLSTRNTLTTRTVVEVTLGALASAVAVLAFWPFYGSAWWLPAVLGGLALGVALALAATVLRWPGWILTPIALVVLVGYELWAVHWAKTSTGVPTYAALKASVDGLVSGWARMLTVALPADASGDLLALPVGLAFAAGFAGTLLATRTAWRLALALPPVVLLVAGLLFTASLPGDGLAVTAATLVVVILLLLIRSEPGRASSTAESLAGGELTGGDRRGTGRYSAWGRLALGLPGLVLIVGIATVGASLLPLADGDAKADPRTLYPEEIQLDPALSPLVEVQPMVLGSDREVFRVKVQWPGGKVPVDRIRIAALDTFDGALWTHSGDFRRAGRQLPDDGPELVEPTTVRLSVDVAARGNAFLPVVGRPARLSGLAAAVNGEQGTLVALTTPTRGDHYVVDGVLPAGDDVQTRGIGAGRPQDTALPDPPAWVRQEATRIVTEANAQTAWGQLVALQSFYRDQPYAPKGPPGQSYAAIYRTLLGTEADRPGHVEQYASGFAVLARALGFPARVAVGYRLVDAQLQGDTYSVGTAQAHAWPEVFLDGYGWVAFEPSNPKNATVLPPPRDPESTAGDDPNDVVPPAQIEQDAQHTGEITRGLTVAGAVERGLWTLLIVFAIIAALMLLTVLAKWLRRQRRRRSGGVERRIRAAWSETRDRLRELGYSATDHDTPGEIAARTATGRAEPAHHDVTELAVITTTAVYSPFAPEEPAAVRAWGLEASIRASLRAGAPRRLRLVALLDPRPLFRREQSAPRRSTATTAAKRAVNV